MPGVESFFFVLFLLLLSSTWLERDTVVGPFPCFLCGHFENNRSRGNYSVLLLSLGFTVHNDQKQQRSTNEGFPPNAQSQS